MVMLLPTALMSALPLRVLILRMAQLSISGGPTPTLQALMTALALMIFQLHPAMPPVLRYQLPALPMQPNLQPMAASPLHFRLPIHQLLPLTITLQARQPLEWTIPIPIAVLL